MSVDLSEGLAALRRALIEIVEPEFVLATVPGAPGRRQDAWQSSWLLAQTAAKSRRARADHSSGSTPPGAHRGTGSSPESRPDDSALATSSLEDEAEGARLIALVELARSGDSEAFGQLYDHYHSSVYRFLYYRVGSVPLAEDLTAETFFRALRSMSSFRWQGKDFGAWLMTIARNLTTDHFKAGRTRLEQTTEDMGVHDDATAGPEDAVLAGLTNEILLTSLK